MNLCLLFYGQLRTFDNINVINSWNKLFKKHNCDNYLCVWDNRGRSAYSVQANLNDKLKEEEIIDINKVKNIFNTNNVTMFSYDKWYNSLSEEIKTYKNNQYFNSTFAAGFLRSKCIENLKKQYDAYLIVRPDLYFINDLNEEYFYDMECIINQNTPYNFFPNRVYDIFIGSNYENTLSICNWYNSELLFDTITNNFNTNLNYLDPCKVLYTYCLLLNIKIRNTKILYADVYRTEQDVLNYKNLYGV